MPHIHTNPGEHDHTASAYIIRIDGAEPRILLHMHKKLHKWMQFGGHIELDETPWQAVCHEVPEETGYQMSQLQILQPKHRVKQLEGNAVLHPQLLAHNTHSMPDNHFHTDLGYGFITREEPANPPAKGESKTFKLFVRQELAELPADQVGSGTRSIALYMLDHCLDNWEALPTSTFI